MEVCLGGGDFNTTSNLEQKVAQENTLAATMASLHATSHETYVRWNMVEPVRGSYDFRFQDAILDADTSHGLRWVPFIITGPAYSLPPWFYHGPNDTGYICLEHHVMTDIQSLWNPAMRPLIRGVYQAFGRHYDSNPNVESVLLGISGNYGETLVPASHMDWTVDTHGPYHTHPGWWVGDRYARADFQKRAREAYGNIEALNADWQTTFTDFLQVEPRLPEQWPGTAAIQWQSQWMLDSMTHYADWCMKQARQAIPSHDIYLVVGGHAPAWHGLDATAQVKAAARDHCGVRITNEGDGFAKNFAITRIVSSAARFYGTYASYEPASGISWRGIAARTFNAASSGLRCLHWYENILPQDPKSRQIWENSRKFLGNKDRKPRIDVAVFYPRRWMNLQTENDELFVMYNDFACLRNATDYDFVDEHMLMDMKDKKAFPFRFLVVRDDFLVDAASRAAVEWLKHLDNPPQIIQFHRGQAARNHPETFLATIAAKLHPGTDFARNVYWTRMDDGKLLFLNDQDTDIDLHQTHPHMIDKPTPLAGRSMTKID